MQAFAAQGRIGWSGTVVFGEIDVDVRAAGAAPAGWPAGGRLRIVATEPACRAAAGGRMLLLPAPPAERPYRLLADALAAEDLAAVLDPGDGSRAARLRSVAGALVAEVAGAAAPDGASACSEEELALALALLRAMPRALTPAAGAPAVPAPPAPVIDLSERRRERERRGAEAPARTT